MTDRGVVRPMAPPCSVSKPQLIHGMDSFFFFLFLSFFPVSLIVVLIMSSSASTALCLCAESVRESSVFSSRYVEC